MRWLTFLIAAYLLLGIQMALAGFALIGHYGLNLILPFAVFIIINAPREHALSGVFFLGLMQDMLCNQSFGLFAFSYSLAALFIIGTKPAIYRDHPITHTLLTLLVSILTSGILVFHGWVSSRLHPNDLSDSPGAWVIFMGIMITSIAAPLLLYPIVRIKGIFGFRANRSPFFRSHRR
jgi:rod shape-determining protein MreD